MLLVRRLGASVEEQAAALLHDVSHTALSHVVDYVLDSPLRQGLHDDQKKDYMARTEIPAICVSHEVDWLALADEGRWPLVEQPSPRLCADCLDYTLSDAVPLGIMDEGAVRAVLSDVVVVSGRLAFTHVDRR